MLKNARFTFEKYSDPNWLCSSRHERAYTYVPDEIFEPLLTTLQARAPDILKYAHDLYQESYKAGRGKEWSWSRTMAFVQDVWNDVDREYGAVIARSIDDAFFRYEDVPYGSGTGACFADFVGIDRENSINDPVCALHESGHLMAQIFASDPDNNEPAFNIKEIQAMFIQEHGYAHLTRHARDAEEALSVRLHRLSYYTGILSNIPLYKWGLDFRSDPTLSTRSLVREFSRWSVDLKMLTVLENMPESAHEAGEENHKNPSQLHTHPFAALLAPALYERFQGKNPGRQREILSVLYKGGPETTLVDVLSAFDIKESEDLRHIAEGTCSIFEHEIALCGFKPVPAPEPRPAV